MIRPVALSVPIIFTSAACTPAPVQPDQLPPSIYYATQNESDIALAAFSEKNPNCKLWTNWQKLCSRSGPAKSVECMSDESRPVRPSTPFCVAEENTNIIVTTERTPAERSALRYCVAEEAGTSTGIRSSQPIRFCNKYAKNRPFSEFRKDVSWHSWCSSDSFRDDYGRFICIPINKPDWCRKVSASGDVLVKSESSENSQIDIAIKYRKNSSPVSSIYCSISMESENGI